MARFDARRPVWSSSLNGTAPTVACCFTVDLTRSNCKIRPSCCCEMRTVGNSYRARTIDCRHKGGESYPRFLYSEWARCNGHPKLCIKIAYYHCGVGPFCSCEQEWRVDHRTRTSARQWVSAFVEMAKQITLNVAMLSNAGYFCSMLTCSSCCFVSRHSQEIPWWAFRRS